MDIRRTILLMIFAFSLLMLWNNWQVHQTGTSLFGETPSTATSNTGEQSASTATTANNSAVPAGQLPSQASSGAQNPTAPAPMPAPGETVEITTDVFKLTFDLNGAQLIRAELLNYPSKSNPDEPTVLLEQNGGRTYIVQTGVVGPPGTSYPTHLVPFRMISTDTELQGDKLDVQFEATSGGVKVIKTFTFKRGDYVIDVQHDVQNISDSPVTPSVYLQITRDGDDPLDTSSFYHTFTGPAVYSEQDKFQKVSFSDIEKKDATFIKTADNGWFAMIQHYFVTAWVPPQGVQRSYDMAMVGDNLYAVRSIEGIGDVGPGATSTIKSSLWVGPQDQDRLEALAPGLDLVVDYGWLTIIAKPLFILMTWIHDLLGNWGWTIVALTVLIKAVFYPLSAASYRSMAKMKQVAPRLQALKEKFGDDRQKLNTAMMEMYRNEKINPLGGCLPILIQIPVFISLYWVLLASVEMRGAPWVLWVDDLSARDPLYILPVIMMATMFLQIKLNPTPPDPMQAKVMMIMPLVFGGFMFFFPAGLVLYWVVNNILSIAQQWYITHKMTQAANQPHR
ncbi:membrane protein insertase YidC [Orrella daihaiensis]|uniref:Membrane protein insertase YidC n=1 Tax=Orrella daihaiensis TaxID=2782176 RepID=A0ABY4AJS9_9BURK|nr:membrane protein insertase YidC [Orrella daihaiensis]UOD50537.1 membrane protein insertase YidC [Orrella daihaiensis]